MSERTIWGLLGATLLALLCCGVLLLGGALLFLAADRAEPARATPGAVALPTRDAPPPAPSPTLGARPTEVPVTPSPAALGEIPPLDPAAPLADLAAGLAPAARAELAAQPDVPLYRIRARFDPAAGEIVGRQSLRWVNREGVALDELYLRLFANAEHYFGGGMAVSGATINGQPVAPTVELGGTALRLPLAEPLAPGAAVELLLDFALTIPVGGGYGILGSDNGITSLYNWHPEVAPYEGGGWLLHPVSQQGDPTNSDIANYEVEIAAPSGWTVLSSGVETVEGSLTRIVAPLTRNLVLVASDQLLEMSRTEGEVTVNSYYRAGNESGAQAALDVSAASLAFFSERFSPYPYAEFDAAEVGLGGGAAGMESTGLILIGSDFYAPEDLGGSADVEGIEYVTFLDHIVAHEVAHQWWYGLVGSDAYLQPWLDESLTNWSSALFFEERRSPEAGVMVRDLYIAMPYYLMLQDEGDQRLDQSVAAFDGMGYGAIVYGKGSVLYDVLRAEIGDEPFFDFLRRYAERYRFGRSDGAGWRATLAEVIDEEAAGAFYERWVEGDDLTLDDMPPPGPFSELFLDGDVPVEP